MFPGAGRSGLASPTELPVLCSGPGTGTGCGVCPEQGNAQPSPVTITNAISPENGRPISTSLPRPDHRIQEWLQRNSHGGVVHRRHHLPAPVLAVAGRPHFPGGFNLVDILDVDFAMQVMPLTSLILVMLGNCGADTPVRSLPMERISPPTVPRQPRTFGFPNYATHLILTCPAPEPRIFLRGNGKEGLLPWRAARHPTFTRPRETRLLSHYGNHPAWA
jgi:hypothetical protein